MVGRMGRGRVGSPTFEGSVGRIVLLELVDLIAHRLEFLVDLAVRLYMKTKRTHANLQPALPPLFHARTVNDMREQANTSSLLAARPGSMTCPESVDRDLGCRCASPSCPVG